MKRGEGPKRVRIRNLRAGESVPAGPPRRYPNKQGYIRLRWTIGPGEQVEVLEHRVVDGVVTDAEHVHHRNHIRDDNRPSNLEPLTAAQHAARHNAEYKRRGRQMARLYRSGHSTVDIARQLGVNPGTVSRRLAELNVEMRTTSDYAVEVDPAEVAELYRSGRSLTSLARQYRVETKRMTSLIREGGATIRKPGRPKPSTAQDENVARLAVRRRSGGMCEVCGKAQATNFQHRKAAGQGGGWSACNGLDVCGMGNVSGCHGLIHQNPTLAYANGWSVRSGHDPATQPVQLAGRGLCLLAPDGRAVPAAEAEDVA